MKVDFEWLDDRLKKIENELRSLRDVKCPSCGYTQDFAEYAEDARSELSDLRNDLHLKSLNEKRDNDKD